jgi:hypothetical protein
MNTTIAHSHLGNALDRTPQQLQDEAIAAGADRAAVHALRRAHQHPLYVNLVRDPATFSAALEDLVSPSQVPESVAPPEPVTPQPSEDTTPEPAPAPRPLEPAAVMRRASEMGNTGVPMLDLALWYARNGIPVFPCSPTDKRPLTPSGFKNRSRDEARIQGWWTLHPDAVPSIVPGDFGMAAFDVDSSPAAAAAEAAGLQLDGLTIATAGKSVPFEHNGRTVPPLHVFVQADAQPAVRGVVVRYLGGYVVAAGARMASGRVYTVHGEGNAQRWAGETAHTAPRVGVANPAALRVPEALGPAAVAEVVRATPNTEDSRDGWVNYGHAIKGALGPEHDAEGLELFQAWSAKWEGPNPPEYVQQVWESLNPQGLGWEYLLDLARRHGVPTAKYDFAPIAPAVAPLPTEGERVAALTGDAEAAFLREAMAFRGDLGARWDTLQHAATQTDPLAQVFEIVLAAALRAPIDRSEAAFKKVVRSKLAAEPAWTALSEPDRALLLAAVLALFQKPDRHVERRSPVPMGRDVKPRDYLVEHLLPRDAMVALIGAPGQGKSWLALELAALVGSAESTWTFGELAVQGRGSVWYLASEDEVGLQERRLGWEAAHGGSTAYLHLFSGVPILSGPLADSIRFVRDAARVGGSPVLIVVDVFVDTVTGDENAVATIAPALYRAKVLGRMLGATILLVHHASKARPEDARGSSAFTGAMDVIGAVVSDDRGIRLKVTKHRSAAAGKELRFHIRDALLQHGPAPRSSTGEDSVCNAEAAAELVGRVVRQIADADTPATRSQLLDAVRAERRDWFDGDARERHRGNTRLSRAIIVAKDRGYIAPKRENRFVPGRVQPPAERYDFEVVP